MGAGNLHEPELTAQSGCTLAFEFANRAASEMA
jgi:hypothetical protein